MKQLVVLDDHSLVRHHLGIVRDRTTSPGQFRHSIRQLAGLLAARATRNLRVTQLTVETPVASCPVDRLADQIGLVPILRAGLMMVEPLLDLIPEAQVWHLGLYRDETTAQPVPYYNKLPEGKPVNLAMVLDPMLATGGSACMACQSMRDWGVTETRVLSVIAAPEGVKQLLHEFPEVEVYTCCVDLHLNERKFIVPGLGDAGDRVFNTL